MKKKLLLFIGVMTTLASCSTEDLIDENTGGDEIKFNASVRFSSATRGIESDNAALNSFYVSAFPVGQESTPLFVNALFYKENGKYVTKNPYHWSHELKLDIFAYGYCLKEKKQHLPENVEESALVSGKAELEVTDMQRTLNNFSPNPKIEDQIDFIFTKELNKSQPGMTNSVSLVFDHMLSEIGVDAVCNSKTHRVKIAKIKYGNIIGTANFNMEYQTPGISGDRPAWSELRDKTTYEIELPKPVTLGKEAIDISLAEKGTNPIGWAILLPQDHSTFNSTTEFFGVGNDGVGPAGKSLASAQYLAVLCRIELLDQTTGEPTGAIKFPYNDDFYVEVPINEYETEVYGWAYIPFHLAKDNDSDDDKAKYSKWQMGHRYRYHLDFTDGAGYNDNGDNIIEGPVSFTASVNPWSNLELNRPRQD